MIIASFETIDAAVEAFKRLEESLHVTICFAQVILPKDWKSILIFSNGNTVDNARFARFLEENLQATKLEATPIQHSLDARHKQPFKGDAYSTTGLGPDDGDML